jgi:two-component system chemotaxis sensor kinase CheA
MKIKTKLLLGLSAFPLLILLLIGSGWYQLSGIKTINNTLQTNYDLTLTANEIHRKQKNEAISLRNIVIFEDEESVQNEINFLQRDRNLVNEKIGFIETKMNSEEERMMIDQLKDTMGKYDLYKMEVIKLVSENKSSEAIGLINKNGYNLNEEFSKNITSITDHLEANMKSSFTNTLEDFRNLLIISGIISLIAMIIIMSILFRNVWNIAIRLNNISGLMNGVTSGKMEIGTKVEVTSSDEIGDVANAFNMMSQSLEEQRRKEQSLFWTKSNIAEITTTLSGQHDLESLSRELLSKIVPLMESCHAVFYIKDQNQEEPTYKLLASYGLKERKHASNTIRTGQGLVGQAVMEKSPIILTDVPPDYVRVQSGIGEAPPLTIYVVPIIFEGDVKAVLEIASFKMYDTVQQSFLEEMISGLGIILDSVMGRIKLATLLEESQTLMEEVQAQSEELQSQQEELRMTNEELEEQTQALRQSEEKLQVQQEELEQTNAELKEKADSLAEQNKRFEITNREVEKARADLEEKARELTLSSKYKSEFLANMSHELRTPLNSLLILSKLLSDNLGGNLSDKQIEFSKTIYSSGNDLLNLINDILDLAKIESGKMDVNPSNIMINDLAHFAENRFRPIANEKNLQFNIVLKDGLPATICSDEQRIQQVLKNLLSNAFKFTKQGEVTLEIDYVTDSSQQSYFLFSIFDTGIGIAKEKQDLIFQAFQQADGTTSRKYGGTGLGLSICKEIALLLGGKIVVESEEGNGSKFTFIVEDYEQVEFKQKNQVFDEVAVTQEIVESKNHSKPPQPSLLETGSNIKRLLIVDDDLLQRNSLMELLGDNNVIINAVSSGSEALEELKVNQFDCMVLDLGLADTTGFDLLEKIDSYVENVKIFIYTGRDLTSKEERFLNKYAHSIIIKDAHSPQRLKDELELFLNSSTEKNVDNPDTMEEQMKPLPGLEGKKVLVVDDDVRNVYALSSILELHGMKISFAENGKEGLETLEKNSDIDLVLMDIMMPEMDGYEAMRRLRQIPEYNTLPVIALTAKAMKEDREKCMEAGASDYIVKPVLPDQLISLISVWIYG